MLTLLIVLLPHYVLLQVLSFIRIAAPFWAIVSILLSQLEAVCRVFKVPLAVVDGHEILQLARRIQSITSSSCGRTSSDAAAGDSAAASNSATAEAGTDETAKLAVGLPDLLCCIANLDELEHLFTSASDELVAAALTVGEAAAATSVPAAKGNCISGAAQDSITVTPGIEQPAAQVSIADAVDGYAVPGSVTSPAAGDQLAPAADTAPAVQPKAQVKLLRVQEPLLQTMMQVCID